VTVICRGLDVFYVFRYSEWSVIINVVDNDRWLKITPKHSPFLLQKVWHYSSDNYFLFVMIK